MHVWMTRDDGPSTGMYFWVFNSLPCGICWTVKDVCLTHMPGIWAEMAEIFQGWTSTALLRVTRLGFLTMWWCQDTQPRYTIADVPQSKCSTRPRWTRQSLLEPRFIPRPTWLCYDSQSYYLMHRKLFQLNLTTHDILLSNSSLYLPFSSFFPLLNVPQMKSSFWYSCLPLSIVMLAPTPSNSWHLPTLFLF